jgi:hypothetical protein
MCIFFVYSDTCAARAARLTGNDLKRHMRSESSEINRSAIIKARVSKTSLLSQAGGLAQVCLSQAGSLRRSGRKRRRRRSDNSAAKEAEASTRPQLHTPRTFHAQNLSLFLVEWCRPSTGLELALSQLPAGRPASCQPPAGAAGCQLAGLGSAIESRGCDGGDQWAVGSGSTT